GRSPETMHSKCFKNALQHGALETREGGCTAAEVRVATWEPQETPLPPMKRKPQNPKRNEQRFIGVSSSALPVRPGKEPRPRDPHPVQPARASDADNAQPIPEWPLDCHLLPR